MAEGSRRACRGAGGCGPAEPEQARYLTVLSGLRPGQAGMRCTVLGVQAQGVKRRRRRPFWGAWGVSGVRGGSFWWIA